MAKKKKVPSVKVLCLTHSYFVDHRPMKDGKLAGVIQFHEHEVPHPDPTDKERAAGGTVILGIADVPEDLYEEYYETHPSFKLLDEFLEEDGEADRLESAATVEDTDDEDEEVEVDAKADDEDNEDGEEKGGEGDQGGGSPNPLAGVDFASDNAMELAAELGLSADDMGKVRPTGKGGAYIVPDVRKASKKRGAATE